jgi:hypothetical protein
MSLDLPTLNEHVSDKVVSETLLLTQGDEIIEKAQNESLAKLREKADAAQDAHASAKAVADANAAVSALLNDPTSVEARTCCASILSVYHENCSTDDDEQFSDSRLLLMLFVMAVCGIVKSLIRHYKVLWLPEAAGCILVGGTLVGLCRDRVSCIESSHFVCMPPFSSSVRLHPHVLSSPRYQL